MFLNRPELLMLPGRRGNAVAAMEFKLRGRFLESVSERGNSISRNLETDSSAYKAFNRENCEEWTKRSGHICFLSIQICIWIYLSNYGARFAVESIWIDISKIFGEAYMSSGLKQDISIGQNLKSLRKRAKLTQREASAQLEILGVPMTEDILAKIEQGRYSVRISVLLALKQIYGIDSFDVFFDGLHL